MEQTDSRGNKYERNPKMPAMERLPWVCHCHQFRNPHPQRPDNPASTCPIKCWGPTTEKSYEHDVIKKKVTCPTCSCNYMASFEVNAFSDVRVCRELAEKDDGALVARQLKAKASADLMSTILHQSADAAFRCAPQIMEKIRL